MVNNFTSGEIIVQPSDIQPKVTVADLQKQYALRFRAVTPIDSHSTDSRNDNIRLAFSKINGMILEDGKTFSFNKVVGRRTQANGFLAAYEYSYGELTLGWGGGVCQASTTVYLAAVQAGMKITDHTAHSTPVSYTSLGEDATVSDTRGHETGGLTIGYATTAYDTHFNYLASQTISFTDFDSAIADMRTKNATFDDALAAIKQYYGLTTEAGQNLSLTEADVAALKAAYTLSMQPEDTRTLTDSDELLYGGYEPLSMAVSHIANNKAGLSYTSYSHTGLPVPVYATGAGAEQFSGMYDDTDLFTKTMSVMGLTK